MNQATWPALREYIDACIALESAKRDVAFDGRPYSVSERQRIRDEDIPKLQEQVTRMETAVREALPLLSAGDSKNG